MHMQLPFRTKLVMKAPVLSLNLKFRQIIVARLDFKEISSFNSPRISTIHERWWNQISWKLCKFVTENRHLWHTVCWKRWLEIVTVSAWVQFTLKFDHWAVRMDLHQWQHCMGRSEGFCTCIWLRLRPAVNNSIKGSSIMVSHRRVTA